MQAILEAAPALSGRQVPLQLQSHCASWSQGAQRFGGSARSAATALSTSGATPDRAVTSQCQQLQHSRIWCHRQAGPSPCSCRVIWIRVNWHGPRWEYPGRHARLCALQTQQSLHKGHLQLEQRAAPATRAAAAPTCAARHLRELKVSSMWPPGTLPQPQHEPVDTGVTAGQHSTDLCQQPGALLKASYVPGPQRAASRTGSD